jgi:hypothetical protein
MTSWPPSECAGTFIPFTLRPTPTPTRPDPVPNPD